jgi:hypothetical protein
MADDIGRWLEDLGFSEYADVFADNAPLWQRTMGRERGKS